MTDNDTLYTTDTALHIGPDGHCLKHPVVELQGRDEDGNKFQRDSCPECDEELQRKLDVLKSKRDQVNEKLANLDLHDDDDDGKVPALQKKHSIPHEPCADEGGWTRLNSSTNSKQLSLEALATQMNRMQQMQDWLLMQKEQEMQALRQRVEDQQQQLVKKEVELALLKEKLSQQETRMEHELKLIKLAAYHRRHKNRHKDGDKRDSTSSKQHHRDGSEDCGDTGGEAKNIHIEALHVNVGNHGGTELTNTEESPRVSKESIEAATKQALQHDYQVDDVVVGELDDYSDQLEAAAEDTKSPSKNAPKNASVGESEASYAMASGQMIDDSNNLSKQGEISSNEDYVQVEAPKEEPPKPQQQADIVLPPDFTRQDTPGISAAGGLPPPTLLTPMQSSVDEDDDEIEMEEAQGVKVPESPGRGEVTTTITPVTTEEDNTALESEMRDTFDVAAPMPAPTMKNENYQSKSARFKIQSDDNRLPGPPEDDFPPGPGGLAAAGGASQVKDGVPYQISDNINPVPLEEQITLDSRFLGDSGRFQNTQRLYPSGNVATQSDEQTVGNTVATSTYGEDRQKVVNQTVLDPYGDSGVYTGVILLSTGMPHGLGRMVYQDDGRTYEGDWRHGRWHGFGRATFANGDSYEGEYRFDQRHGRGLYQWSDGRQYDGEFDEDKRHGKGTFKWPDGAIYIGDFVYGQREGTGSYTFSDGGCYEGDWVDGRYEGYGECTWEDGRVYKGEWVQGMAHGRGVETYANGEIRHEGLWESDEPIRET